MPTLAARKRPPTRPGSSSRAVDGPLNPRPKQILVAARRRPTPGVSTLRRYSADAPRVKTKRTHPGRRTCRCCGSPALRLA
eukprot:11136647-Lingulodinium_polyedra.AAC.1